MKTLKESLFSKNTLDNRDLKNLKKRENMFSYFYYVLSGGSDVDNNMILFTGEDNETKFVLLTLDINYDETLNIVKAIYKDTKIRKVNYDGITEIERIKKKNKHNKLFLMFSKGGFNNLYVFANINKQLDDWRIDKFKDEWECCKIVDVYPLPENYNNIYNDLMKLI